MDNMQKIDWMNWREWEAHPSIVIEAVATYHYNVEFDEVWKDVFGEKPRHPDYIAEWLERWKRGWMDFYAHLDGGNRRRYVIAAMRRYGEEAARRVWIEADHDEDRDRPIHRSEDEVGDDGESVVTFTESARGEAARENWARRYDDLNGAPEDEGDR